MGVQTLWISTGGIGYVYYVIIIRFIVLCYHLIFAVLQLSVVCLCISSYRRECYDPPLNELTTTRYSRQASYRLPAIPGIL